MDKPLSEMSWSELIDETVKLQQRNAALAAQVERLRTACQIAFQTPLDEHYSKGVNVALCHAIESTAETSLARLKAEAKGELLSTVRELDLTTNNGDVRRDAEWRAGWNQCIRELRRQAKGENHD